MGGDDPIPAARLIVPPKPPDVEISLRAGERRRMCPRKVARTGIDFRTPESVAYNPNMTHRPTPTFADYLVIAITPALIMLLVGSLAYFLLYAFYAGPFGGRLRYVATLYVLAVVLISRIAIERSTSYAALFAFPLALAAWMALARFTDASSFFIVLILAVIWWAADRLTWDCTVIDEGEEVGGEGLLQAAGFAAEHGPTTKLPNGAAGVGSWFQRWWEGRRRPHAPGVWIVYFALVTLPLFGWGQWSIPASELATRRAAFHCLVVYVGSGLALLGTTCFLGLRRTCDSGS